MRVVANSLPKSGTHLLVRFLELLRLNKDKPNLTGALVRITERNPFRCFAKRQRLWREGMSEPGIMVDLDDSDNRICVDWLKKKLHNGKNNCFRTAHLPYSEELESMLLSLDYKMLFIIRDPRDVVVSHLYYVLRDPKHPLYSQLAALSSVGNQINFLLKGRKHTKGHVLAPLSQRIQNVLGWWKSPRNYSVRFEELIGPKGSGSTEQQHKHVSKMCTYLGVPLSADECRDIADRLFYSNAKTFHKGTIGQWKSTFSQANYKLFKETCGRLLVELGYEKNMDW